jgi:hypothetical protein
MTDTPSHIKDLQLKLWLSKTPGERLFQFLIDNDTMLQGLKNFKKQKKYVSDEITDQKEIETKQNHKLK